MRFSKAFSLALNMLLHSRLRSWLTIIGIVIGVAAVVAIVSIGEGLQQSVESRLGGLGADIVTIGPGGNRAVGGIRTVGFGEGGGNFGFGRQQVVQKNLTNRDLQALKGVSDLLFIDGVISQREDVYYNGEKATLNIEGVDPVAWEFTSTATIDTGRLLGPSDSNSVVVGSDIAKNVYKETLNTNSLLVIAGKSFRIVGILQPSTGVGGDDNRIVMPIGTARSTLTDVSQTNFDSFVVKVSDPALVTQFIENADTALMNERHVTANTKDYSITSAQALQEQISSVTSTLTLFLGAIAAVSLIVGAVGIANTMFTSVLEKTKEIGIMKAIGARNSDIMKIFILNAGMVGLVGGIIGIIFGTVISSFLPSLFGASPIGRTLVTFRLLAYALLVSVATGVIAGAVPAYRASKLKPVDALRYE